MLRDLDRFLLQNEHLLADLRRIEPMIDFEKATLLYATADFNALTAIGRWVQGWTAAPRHLFVLLPGHFEVALAGGVGMLDQLFYRYGFAQFPRSSDRVTLLTLSARQAAEFSTIGGRPVRAAPYPVGESEDPPPPPGLARVRRRVSVLGSSRNSKGFDLLPELIRTVRAARPTVDFAVQYCPSEGALPDTATAIAQAGAEVIEGYLERGSYRHELRAADILLLPYRGLGYRVGTSAVFAEARWYGRPALVATGTSMAGDVAADPPLGRAAEPTAQALATALIGLVDDFPNAARAAGEAGIAYRRDNGTHRFAELLLGTPAR